MSYDPCMYAAQLAERQKEAQNYLCSYVASTGHRLHLTPVVQLTIHVHVFTLQALKWVRCSVFY